MIEAQELKTLIGKRIAYMRKLKNYTQEQFAELCNISISSLAAIERGVSYPKGNTLIKFMKILSFQKIQLYTKDAFWKEISQ